MKQIYDFERYTLPVLNENMLRRKLERRRLQWQTALFALAGILMQIVAALFGYAAVDWYPWLSVICFGYVIVSATGGAVVALVYSRKGGATT